MQSPELKLTSLIDDEPNFISYEYTPNDFEAHYLPAGFDEFAGSAALTNVKVAA